MADNENAAMVGYNAYGESTGWLNCRDEPMSQWGDLTQRQRTAWIAAATAIEQSAQPANPIREVRLPAGWSLIRHGSRYGRGRRP